MGKGKKERAAASAAKSSGKKGRGGKESSDEEDAVKGRAAKRQERKEWSDRKRKDKSFKWSKDDMAVLGPQLGELGLAIREVTGDGNCLFRSVSDGLYGNEGRHFELRARCVAFMEANPDSFAPFMLEEEGWTSFDSYLSSMSRDAEWGGNLELMALSSSLRINVTIHQAGQRPWMMTNSPFGPATPSLHVSYHDGQHYNAVRANFDMNCRPAAALRYVEPEGSSGGGGGAGGGGSKAGSYEIAAGKTTIADLVVRAGASLDYVLAFRPKPPAAAAAAAAVSPAAAAGKDSPPEAADGAAAGSDGKAAAVGGAGAAPAAAEPEADDATAAVASDGDPPDAGTGSSRVASGAAAAELTGASPAKSSGVADTGRPRRNGPCTCGSGKAYRKCCMDIDLAAERKQAAIKAGKAEKGDSDADTGKRKKKGAKGKAESDDEEAAPSAAPILI